MYIYSKYHKRYVVMDIGCDAERVCVCARACTRVCVCVCVDLQRILAYFASYITWAGLKKLINLVCSSSIVSFFGKSRYFLFELPYWTAQRPLFISAHSIIRSGQQSIVHPDCTTPLLGTDHLWQHDVDVHPSLADAGVWVVSNSVTVRQWSTQNGTLYVGPTRHGVLELFPWWVAILNENVLWWNLGNNIDQNTAATEHLKQNTELWYHMLW